MRDVYLLICVECVLDGGPFLLPRVALRKSRPQCVHLVEGLVVRVGWTCLFLHRGAHFLLLIPSTIKLGSLTVEAHTRGHGELTISHVVRIAHSFLLFSDNLTLNVDKVRLFQVIFGRSDEVRLGLGILVRLRVNVSAVERLHSRPETVIHNTMALRDRN